ncbi:hypothetical protein [Streptomyces kanamyceticus]|uniref:Uncharacterized protein n=1 Tax=Streptomyces kanamyceticus TaxID=1967 RepID=A0A5J6GLI4_STRKN|nr:hypothetical protein [Streptomyces kanamyceticus]QEU96780.1 hypothetical protein CP970_42805 [Streptomyces kanamyceticus]
MPDLVWDDVRDLFDPEAVGALPDVSVAGTSVTDWQAVFDLVRSSGWPWEYLEGGIAGRLPPAAEVLARPADADTVVLRVWPAPEVLMIFRPTSADEIAFDIDLRELQGQCGVDLLCAFLATVGRRLGKPVTMTAEGDSGSPVLGFVPASDGVVLLTETRLN